ncbi:MAG: type II secretion system protein [Candidatus Omnitrophota bacterium]
MRKTGNGFTLVEMLVTITILVTGVVVTLQMMSIGMFSSTVSENEIIALRLAQEKMEEIKDADYVGINGFSLSRTNLGGDFADFDRAVTVSGDPKQVDVTVYWDAKGQEQNIVLTTLCSDYDY